MLKLHKITYSDNGRKINYDYSVNSQNQKFFTKNEKFYCKYNVDVSGVPQNIAVIPFLSNILPIAWYAGFDIEVEEVDEDFYFAQEIIKKEFAKRDKESELKGKLVAGNLIKNELRGTKSTMLFSGGVDAYATYIRIFDKKPDLVTIHGADIDIKDEKQWEDFTEFIDAEDLLKHNNKEYIETNVRDFYTYQVELLIKDIGWWGKVQHGLSLIGTIAPLSFVNGYSSIYIASSYTDQINIDWGSMPSIDERITWAGIKVFHDGYELKRQDKVDLISQFSTETKAKFKLRVCYSELRNEFNCSNCEKCFRSILGIILNNKNPNDFGFNVDESVYDNMFKVLNHGSSSKGVQYFWQELMEKSKETDKFFIFKNNTTEEKQIDRIRKGEIDLLLESKIKNSNQTIKRIRFVIRNKYPWLQTFYRKLRY